MVFSRSQICRASKQTLCTHTLKKKHNSFFKMSIRIILFSSIVISLQSSNPLVQASSSLAWRIISEENCTRFCGLFSSSLPSHSIILPLATISSVSDFSTKTAAAVSSIKRLKGTSMAMSLSSWRLRSTSGSARKAGRW